ncbi:MAG: hypothetical protein ORN49_01565 [Rhodobacteraceae bacterium]|nr:hypothetical protein [Paracoccaceae bacterium]
MWARTVWVGLRISHQNPAMDCAKQGLGLPVDVALVEAIIACRKAGRVSVQGVVRALPIAFR